MPLQWYARGSRGVFVPVSRHPLWVHIGMRVKRGSRGLRPWRGLGCPQILPFFSFAAGGGRRKGVQRASLCLTRMPMGIPCGCPVNPLFVWSCPLWVPWGRLVLCSLPYVRFHKGKWHAVAVLDRGGQANHPPD